MRITTNDNIQAISLRFRPLLFIDPSTVVILTVQFPMCCQERSLNCEDL
jgi:hypothetical protein